LSSSNDDNKTPTPPPSKSTTSNEMSREVTTLAGRTCQEAKRVVATSNPQFPSPMLFSRSIPHPVQIPKHTKSSHQLSEQTLSSSVMSGQTPPDESGVNASLAFSSASASEQSRCLEVVPGTRYLAARELQTSVPMAGDSISEVLLSTRAYFFAPRGGGGGI
jgi:hypothetical protein